MSDKDIYKECAATLTATLEECITNPCIPKNENEWWASREIERLRAENETLRRDVKTAVMGDSAELADVKRENEKLREALIGLYKPVFENPVEVGSDLDLALRAAAVALKESGE